MVQHDMGQVLVAVAHPIISDLTETGLSHHCDRVTSVAVTALSRSASNLYDCQLPFYLQTLE